MQILSVGFVFIENKKIIHISENQISQGISEFCLAE
jgi:hypothetical protein